MFVKSIFEDMLNIENQELVDEMKRIDRSAKRLIGDRDIIAMIDLAHQNRMYLIKENKPIINSSMNF